MGLPTVVKIISDDSGYKRDNPVWCYVHTIAGGNATLCGGEYFGYGENSCTYKVKTGKITCQRCREIIKRIKTVQL